MINFDELNNANAIVMKTVETIYPYAIIEENGYYGIVDKSGNIVIPCVMDDICNTIDEEIGLELWKDYYCVCIIKDGKYGFFTNNGKFIEPEFERFTIDPCGGDIHVKTESGFGVLASPEYILEEIPIHYSLLSDEFEEDYDIGGIDVERLLDDECTTWEQAGVEGNVVSAISARLHKLGYEYTEQIWDSTRHEKGEVNMQEFVSVALSKLNDNVLLDEWVTLLKYESEADEAMFWNIAENDEVYEEILIPWCANMTMRGAATFISRKVLLNADIPLLNSMIAEHLNDENRKSTIAGILTECGIYLLSFSDCGRSPRFYNKYTTGDVVDEDVDYLYVFNNEVWLVLNGATTQVISVPLEETSESYSRIVEEIMAAANAARVVL